MKKYFIIIILAIITGGLLGYYTFHGNSANAKGFKTAYLIQIGVYKSKENANKKAASLTSSIVIPEGDYYHVYSNIFTDLNLVKKVSNFYDSINLHYYVKNIEIDLDTYSKIADYEALLVNVDDVNTILRSSKELLGYYGEYRQNEEN